MQIASQWQLLSSDQIDCWALVGPAVANVVVARFEAQMASARFNVVGAVLLLFLPTCGAFALQNALRTRVLSPSIALSANNDDFDLAARVETVVANINEGTFGERGEAWVFGQFGLLFAILGAPAIPGLSTLAAIAGILSILGGGALAVAGAYGLGSDLTPWPKPTEANTLKTSGIYSLCRHPVYSGLLAACLRPLAPLGLSRTPAAHNLPHGTPQLQGRPRGGVARGGARRRVRDVHAAHAKAAADYWRAWAKTRALLSSTIACRPRTWSSDLRLSDGLLVAFLVVVAAFFYASLPLLVAAWVWRVSERVVLV